MKNLILFLQLFCLCALMSCGGSARSGSCLLTVHYDDSAFTGSLRGLDGLPMDDITASGSVLQLTDSASMPFVAYIHLTNREDSMFTMDMPVVVEAGNVRVNIGEYISTSGTPLNARLQDFLDELQRFSDGLSLSVDLDGIKSAYSEFYRSQILLNRGNAVGAFILRMYGIHLTDADREAIETVLNN